MNVQSALDALLSGNPIVVAGKTFTPTQFEKIHLETGETQYWVHGEGHVWLAIDAEAEEVLIFEDIDEEVEVVDDVVPHGGEDFELSLEQKAKVIDEDDEQLDKVEFRDFESTRGQILRLSEFEVSEDTVDVALGQVVTEEELQEA